SMGSRCSSTALRRTSPGLRRIAGLASATSSSSSDAGRAEGWVEAARAAAFVSAGRASALVSAGRAAALASAGPAGALVSTGRAAALVSTGRAAALVSADHSSSSLDIIGLPSYQHLRPSIMRQDQKPPEPALVLHCCLASAVPPMMSAVTPAAIAIDGSSFL